MQNKKPHKRAKVPQGKTRTPNASKTKATAAPSGKAQAPRNFVALALAKRTASGGAGKHEPSTGAQRRAQKMQLQRQLRHSGDGPA